MHLTLVRVVRGTNIGKWSKTRDRDKELAVCVMCDWRGDVEAKVQSSG